MSEIYFMPANTKFFAVFVNKIRQRADIACLPANTPVYYQTAFIKKAPIFYVMNTEVGENSNRLLALDVFRGITVAGMVLGNNPGNWSAVYAPRLFFCSDCSKRRFSFSIRSFRFPKSEIVCNCSNYFQGDSHLTVLRHFLPSPA